MAAFPAALADFSEGAAAARAAGDRRLEMLALRWLGGDAPVAHGMPIGYCESHLAEGLRLAELLGDQAIAADLLARLADRRDQPAAVRSRARLRGACHSSGPGCL